MDYSLLYPGRFLKSAEFGGKDVTLTVTKVRTEELEGEKGTRVRGIVSFAEDKKELVLNRTNGECIKAMFGRETDIWTGKRLTLFPAPFRDSFTGEDTTAIRVRGSPDIKSDMQIEVHLPRKKPIRMVMRKTGQQVAGGSTAKGDTGLEARRLALWKTADGRGIDKDRLLAWAAEVLGARKSWRTWTVAECERLEQALVAMEPPHDPATGELPPEEDAAP